MAFRHIALSIALLSGPGISLPAQTVATIDIAKRVARSHYTLGHIYVVRELSDGRVVATDTKEGIFRLVDFAHNDVGILGTQGDEPDQYRRALQMITLPADSIGMIDAATSRVMHVSAQGAIGNFTPMPRGQRRLGGLVGSDAKGALYFTTLPQIDTATRSIAAVQWLTRLAADGQADQPVFSYRTRRADQTVHGIMPFYFADAIAVRGDGLAARVVADSYQVIWYRDGKESGRSGLLDYQPIPISEAEQTAIRDSIVQMFKTMTAGAGGTGRTIVMNGGSAGATSMGGGRDLVMTSGSMGGGTFTSVAIAPMGSAPAAAAPAGTPAGGAPAGGVSGSAAAMVAAMNPADMVGTFPATKPPIIGGTTTALFDDTGSLWIMRERMRGDLVPHYDVVAEARGIVAHVNLPAGTRLVGFGKNVVYLARVENGSDWLERYALPKM